MDVRRNRTSKAGGAGSVGDVRHLLTNLDEDEVASRIAYASLLKQLDEAEAAAQEVRNRVRGRWLTMTRREREGLTPPPVCLTRCCG